MQAEKLLFAESREILRSLSGNQLIMSITAEFMSV